MKKRTTNHYYSYTFSTPLGKMTLIATEKSIYSLAFSDCEQVRSEQEFQIEIIDKPNEIMNVLLIQLNEYFAHDRKLFHIPLTFSGTPLQKSVWEQLQKIPYGQIISYHTLAKKIQNERAVRAVATSCGKNPFVIIIPCHRVVASNGKLSGYSGGIERKQWLLNHENTEFQ